MLIYNVQAYVHKPMFICFNGVGQFLLITLEQYCDGSVTVKRSVLVGVRQVVQLQWPVTQKPALARLTVTVRRLPRFTDRRHRGWSVGLFPRDNDLPPCC